MPELLTTAEAAELLRVSEWWIYMHGEELGVRKVGGRNRYPVE